MDHQADPQWLSWTKRLQSIAQTGLTFTRDHYDHQRYEELRDLAAEMMAAGAGMPDSQKVLDLFRGQNGYATPKVEVRGAVIREDRILLVRERDDGEWTLPGGWADQLLNDRRLAKSIFTSTLNRTGQRSAAFLEEIHSSTRTV